MKTFCLGWLLAGLLAVPHLVAAQPVGPAAPASAAPGSYRAVLGGPPSRPDAAGSELAAPAARLAQLLAAPAAPASRDSLLQACAQLTRQLAQQVADLRRELATVQQVNRELLLDHVTLQETRQQLNLLLSQQAALGQRRPGADWPAGQAANW